MVGEWIVILEVDEDPPGSLGLDDFERLFAQVTESQATLLRSADRYALQLLVAADTCADALNRALCRWRDAIAAAAVPEAPVVRAEVLTLIEFERECAATGQRESLSDALRDAVAREHERRRQAGQT